MFTSSSSLEREIDEYQDVSLGSGSSNYESNKGSIDYSSDCSSLDEHYSSEVPGFPLEEF